MNDDYQNLKVLGMLHFALAVPVALLSCCTAPYLLSAVMGMLVPVIMPHDSPGMRPMPTTPFVFTGALMLVFVLAVILLIWIVAGVISYCGMSLLAHRKYMFCFVVAAVESLFFPLGTLLGIFTIMVLLRPSVQQIFEAPPESSPFK